MEERRCPKCENPIATENKFCPNCGFELSAEQAQPAQVPPIPPPTKKAKSARGLWLAAILIIVGLIVAGTLTAYVAVSSFDSAKWGTLFEGSPRPESAAPASSAADSNENAAQQDAPKVTPVRLIELPSTAPANDYITLKQGVTVQYNDGVISFACTLENISGVVCTGAGVEVELYDAAMNFIGSSSSWVYRDIQPGEVLELSFESENAQNALAFCLTKVGGKPIETPTNPKASETPVAPSEAVPVDDGPDVQAKTPAPSKDDIPLIHGLTLLGGVVEKVQESYLLQLQGRIRNDSEVTYNSVFVKFVIYDSENNQISTTTAYTRDFEPGVTWKFSAPLSGPAEQAVSYKISSISVF